MLGRRGGEICPGLSSLANGPERFSQRLSKCWVGVANVVRQTHLAELLARSPVVSHCAGSHPRSHRRHPLTCGSISRLTAIPTRFVSQTGSIPSQRETHTWFNTELAILRACMRPNRTGTSRIERRLEIHLSRHFQADVLIDSPKAPDNNLTLSRRSALTPSRTRRTLCIDR